MKSIVYHNIKPYDKKYKYNNYLNPKIFERQIHLLKKNYNFFDCQILFNKNFKYDQNNIFLTFDDSLKNHYEFAYPILKRNRINAIFYIPSLPYINKKILNVHKIHLILSKYKSNIVHNFLTNYIKEKKITINTKVKYLKNIYQNQNIQNTSQKIKILLNYSIDKKLRNCVINATFNKFFPDFNEKRFIKDYYLSEHEIEKMSRYMIIGSHTYSHKLLDELSTEDAENEIDKGIRFVEKFTDLKTFSYPFGFIGSFNKLHKYILKKKKITFSVSVTNKKITERNWILDKQDIPRIDCNYINFQRNHLKKIV
jgi:peptidoglycan/xylan/chitin deacetylase (PgdA/CDA1 family)